MHLEYAVTHRQNTFSFAITEGRRNQEDIAVFRQVGQRPNKIVTGLFLWHENEIYFTLVLVREKRLKYLVAFSARNIAVQAEDRGSQQRRRNKHRKRTDDHQRLRTYSHKSKECGKKKQCFSRQTDTFHRKTRSVENHKLTGKSKSLKQIRKI